MPTWAGASSSSGSRGPGRASPADTGRLWRSGAAGAVFVFGYAKSSRSTVDPRELAGFRLLAKHVLAMSAGDVDRAVETGAFEEVRCDEQASEAVRE